MSRGETDQTADTCEGPSPAGAVSRRRSTPRKPSAPLTEADLVVVAAMGAAGARQEDIARRLGMTAETWRKVRDADARVGEAFAAGRAELHAELMSKLIEKAKKGEVAPLLFALKVLYGYRDNAVAPSEVTHNVRIELPRALTPDDYERLRRIEPRAPVDVPAVEVDGG